MTEGKKYQTEIEYENGFTQENLDGWRDLITLLVSCIQQLIRNKRLSAKKIVIEEWEREVEEDK